MHDDAWLYSIFLPIDAGLLNLEQIVQALDYTEWGLERVPMPGGGERIWTSNWVPTGWSNRMLWPAHCYSLALAYAQAGLPMQAWNMLQGGFVEACFNETTPGGFASGTTGTDFHEDVCTFGRAVVEGLFGYCPDYPNGRVRCAPQFPADWNHASISTPDFTLSFKRNHGEDRYDVTLTQPAALELRVPVRARKVTAVEIDGKPATYRMEPGFGQTVLIVELPQGSHARLSVHSIGALPRNDWPSADGAVHLQVKAGDVLRYASPDGPVTEWRDPQGVLQGAQIVEGALTATLARNAGHHLVLAQMQCGDLPQWRLLKLEISDPQAIAEAAAMEVGPVPPTAQWECLDLGAAFNGDVRAIYKQSYVSPRPKTCSLRIGDNGYHSWPFYYWQSNPSAPPIDLKGVNNLLDANGQLRTPQGVPFRWLGENRNIAYTSLWDNWPKSVTVPVGRSGEAAWFLVCGSTNVMQTQIANAVLRLRYADGKEDRLELVPPVNFWSLGPVAGDFDYNYERDAFCLPPSPPPMVQLGANCRAMVLSRRLRPDVALVDVTLETLSQEVVVGLMGVTLMR